MDDWYQWYWNDDIKFKIIQYTRDREFIMVSPNWSLKRMAKRYNRVHSVQHLDWQLKNWYFRNNGNGLPCNLYTSVASFKNGMVYTSPSDSERKKEIELFKEEYFSHLSGYDLFIDIDAPDHSYMDICVDDAVRIYRELKKEFNVVDIRFSGKGIHLVVPFLLSYGTLIKDDPKSILEYCKSVGKRMYDDFSELVDLNVYDWKRFHKCPYSLVLYPNRNYFISLPLSIHKLKNFNLEMARPSRVLRDLKDDRIKENNPH